MTVMAAGWMYPALERGAALSQAVVMLAARLGAPGGDQPPRVYQGYLEPDAVLLVTNWESREAHRAWLDAHAGEFEDLVGVPSDSLYFRLGRTYGVMGRCGNVALCALIRTPPGAGESVRALWGDAADVLHSVEGFAYWYAYVDEDDADHFMTITLWESITTAEAYLNGPAFEMLRRLGAAGAELEPFFGVA
jgi:heme-degrading monooxygenase HmoA